MTGILLIFAEIIFLAIAVHHRHKLSQFMRAQLKPDTKIPPAAQGWWALISRCRLTVLLLVVNLAIYLISTGFTGAISQQMESEWGFSWNRFVDHPLQSLILSPFLHFNTPHLMTNLLCMTIFLGGLEYLTGSLVAGISYVIPMLSANPITGLLAISLFKPMFPELNENAIDVGASLGIFGAAGCLFLFLKHGKYCFLAMVLVIVAGYIFGDWRADWIWFNHCIALLLGAAVGKILSHKPLGHRVAPNY